jgi:hypothetical protein
MSSFPKKNSAAMISAPVAQGADFKRFCMSSGRYDPDRKHYFQERRVLTLCLPDPVRRVSSKAHTDPITPQTPPSSPAAASG